MPIDYESSDLCDAFAPEWVDSRSPYAHQDYSQDVDGLLATLRARIDSKRAKAAAAPVVEHICGGCFESPCECRVSPAPRHVVEGWPAWATITEQASQRGADEARALVEGPAVVAYVRDTAPAARTVAGMLAALGADEAARRPGYLNIPQEVGTDCRLMNLSTIRGLRVVTL